MNEDPLTRSRSSGDAFSRKIGVLEARKLEAKRRGYQGIWLGFGMFGLIGWAVAIPTLVGTFLGAYMDRKFPGVHSWTLSLLIVGLLLGCLNAWHWVAREEKIIREDKEKTDE